ncbi:MAG TPA: PEP/pyruvate-binding domain-containing protein [Pyrinomonadaceae bacterium]|nr:PEP/pyruvate-binding domain-containing protein [Pyrinomonadaceae bacterium]
MLRLLAALVRRPCNSGHQAMDSHGFCFAGWKAATRRRTLKLSNSILLLAIVAAGLPVSEATGQETRSKPRSLPAITSRAEFDSLARIYSDRSYPLPHLLFVIDRKDKNKIYYVNSTRYPFHKDFVNGTYLSLERGQEFFENNYLKPNRRFILGTVAYQTPLKRWTFEFWEGDLIPADQIKSTSEIINQSFFQPVAFKPNSLRQEEASAGVEGLARILQSEIASEQAYEPLNLASGIGRIHIIEKLDEHVEIGSNEILVLNEVPIQLPPVAGIILAQPSTPLSHINLLVKGWGVPNAYIKNAHQLLKEFDGWWVSFETRRDTYVIKRADLGQVKEYQQRMASRPDLIKPRSDLTVTRIALLSQQRARDVIAYGGKSANLGEMLRARLPGIIVPSGFTVPFFYYDQFISENNLDESIHEMMNDQKFVHDPVYRRRRLADLRERIQNGALNDQLRGEVLRLVHTQFSGKGLFARSSSNSEDLPNFSGAGIHSSVPNVKGDHQLIEAIKTVWASLWNFEAYEARERAGIDHGQVYMAVLIQEGINADSAGVMLTTDPYDRENKSAYYISAKRGLGIKVVEGKRVAEQIIFRPQTNTIQVLTRSAEDSLLTFDEKGGVKEVPISGERAVLTDEMIRKLVKAAQGIKRVFGGRDQDIEWIYVGGQIYIVQARPFVA